MSSERFEEIVSVYADGKATAEELAELETLLKGAPSLRREFVERMRLEVSLGTLYESAAAAPARRTARSVRPVVQPNRSFRTAIGLAAAILAGIAIYLATRPRPEPATPRKEPVVAEVRPSPEVERVEAESDRKAKEERLAEIRRQEEEALHAERRKDEALQRQAEENKLRLQAEREAAEAALRQAETRERRAIENVTPAPPLPPPAPAATRVIVAKVDRLEGDVFILSRAGRAAATPGQELPAGAGIECGARSFAVVSYPDRTRVEVTGNTVIRDLFDDRGKQLYVEKGAVKADIAKQPKDKPMIFGMAHGETKVLGTVFRLSVDPKSAILEVEEGRVELRNLAGKTVDVAAGRMAVATGTSLSARPLPVEEGILALDFEDGKPSPLVLTGTVERGPANRICLAGAADPSGISRLFIGDAARGLFTYQGDEVLSFDYWVDPQAVGVNFNFYDRTRGRNFDGALPKLVLGKWTHASIRLADLGDAANRIAEDDWIIQLYVQAVGGATPVKRFYVDNVQVARLRVLKPRK